MILNFYLEIFFLHENCPVLPLKTSWRGFLVIPLITLVSNRWSPSWTNSNTPAMGQRTGTGSFSARFKTLLVWTRNNIVLTDHDIVFPGNIIGKLYPGTYCVEIILGKHNTLTKPVKEKYLRINFGHFLLTP